jgi:hypothetical protein
MRKHAVLFTLTVLEIAALLLTTFFWFVMRPDLLGTYRAGALPLAAEIALSTWFVPATSVAGALTVAAAFLPWSRTKTRTYLAGAGLVCTVFGIAFAIFAAYAPAFERLARALGTERESSIRERSRVAPREGEEGEGGGDDDQHGGARGLAEKEGGLAAEKVVSVGAGHEERSDAARASEQEVEAERPVPAASFGPERRADGEESGIGRCRKRADPGARQCIECERRSGGPL